MQTLGDKVKTLSLTAYRAAKLATFWQTAIDQHGETKAEEFYRHLGLNHLERKGYEWEGLTLSREPKEYEKIAVKGVHQAQESSKEAVTKILLDLRTDLISDGLKGIKKLKPANFHELTLQASPNSRLSLRDRLIKVYNKGRRLLDNELADQRLLAGKSTAQEYPQMKDAAEDEFEDLDLLTDLTNGRVVNDVASRIIAAAQRYSLLGLTGSQLTEAVQSEINSGSVAYIDRAATGVANQVISMGRSDEAQNRSDDWERIEYSALLDQNVCDPCSSADGETATNEDDLTPAPNPDCAGGDWCRCFHVFIAN